MIKKITNKHYGYEVLNYQQLSVGAGSNTYLVETDQGKYILKNPGKNEMNNPAMEPQLCAFLLEKEIPVSVFIKNHSGSYLTQEGSELFHLQKFVEGNIYPFHKAPTWLMADSAQLLGKTHAILREFPKLPIGIGENFFRKMTPDKALRSYFESVEIARNRGDHQAEDDLNFRIYLLRRYELIPPDLSKFTCGNTHGDYVINQMICGQNQINAIIDWTSACVHPLVWEIMRSFVYSEPSCAQGQINVEKLVRYLHEYLQFHPLPLADINFMPYIFYYQIAVCDYYHQYYYSTAENRTLFADQAHFSTQLMRWFDQHLDDLSDQLNKFFK